MILQIEDEIAVSEMLLVISPTVQSQQVNKVETELSYNCVTKEWICTEQNSLIRKKRNMCEMLEGMPENQKKEMGL